MASIWPVSLEADSKINLTTCYQGDTKNGHILIDVTQHSQVILLLHFPKALISKLSAYILKSWGELTAEALCVCSHSCVYKNTCTWVGIHVEDRRQTSWAIQYFASLTLAWDFPSRLGCSKPLDLPVSTSPVMNLHADTTRLFLMWTRGSKLRALCL